MKRKVNKTQVLARVMEGFLTKWINILEILYHNSISLCTLQLNVLPWFVSQHVAERSWMLQLLVDGMKDSPDYYLYKRRHVIELALSYHDSPVSDHHSQVRRRHVGLHQVVSYQRCICYQRY